MLHRKNSVARKIQDYLLSPSYSIMSAEPAWCWFPIPNNPEFCVALEWQNGYENSEHSKEVYGWFGQEDGKDFWVVNASIKMTNEFRINGEYALYAEYYFNKNEDDELYGGSSLTQGDIDDDFYVISEWLAKEFNRLNRMKRVR